MRQALLARMLSDGGRHDLAGADLEPLAEYCGRLPLALRLAAGYLTSTDRPLASLPARPGARSAEVPERPGGRADGARGAGAIGGPVEPRRRVSWRGVGATWRSFRRRSTLTAAAAVWDVEQDDAQDTLDACASRAWSNATPACTACTTCCASSRWRSRRRTRCIYRHAEHYLDLGSAADDLYQEGQAVAGLLAFDAVLPHLRAAYDWMRQQSTLRGAAVAERLFRAAPPNVLDLRVSASQRIELLETAASGSPAATGPPRRGASSGQPGDSVCGPGASRAGHRVLRASAGHQPGDQRPPRRGDASGQPGEAYAALGRSRAGHRVPTASAGHQPGDRGPPRRGELLWATWGTRMRTWGKPSRPSSTTGKRWPSAGRSGTAAARVQDLGNLGNAYAALGHAEQAIEYYGQALAISREIGDRRGEGNSLGNLGIAYAALGRAEQAIEYLRASAGHQPGDRGPPRRGAASGQPGERVCGPGAQPSRPSSTTGKRWPSAGRSATAAARGTDLGNLGNAYAALGQAEQAIEYYGQALAISREIGDRRGEGN